MHKLLLERYYWSFFLFFEFRFLALTSQNQVQLRYWMTSNRVKQITSGLVYFVILYGVGTVIFNTLQDWNIFPTYTVCMLDSITEVEDNSVAMAFFVMPSGLMATIAPIIDLVTYRLMKLWQNSQQIPKGTTFGAKIQLS